MSPQAVKRSVGAANRSDVAAGHPGEGADSPGAVLAAPGAGRVASSRMPGAAECRAALRFGQRRPEAGEAQRPHLTAPPPPHRHQAAQASPVSADPLPPPLTAEVGPVSGQTPGSRP